MDPGQEYGRFEKRHGPKAGIEEAITSKRRFEYEEAVARRPRHYDGWFDYLRAEEEGGMDPGRVRALYERAVAQVPPAGPRGAAEKDLWRRYVYLWVKYALFEELDMKDAGRAREVLKKCLEVVPHRAFTFAKVWLLAAKLEIRQQISPRPGGCWARPSGSARRRSSSGSTSRWSSSWVRWTVAGSSTKSSCSGGPACAGHGAGGRSWKRAWGRWSACGRSSVWLWRSLCWTGPSCCGRPSSISRSGRASERGRGACTSASWRRRSTQKSG